MGRTDNFNRANNASSIGTPSDGGSAWVVQTGGWGIISNFGYSASPVTNGTIYLESSLANVDVQFKIIGHSAGWDMGLILRNSDSSNHFLCQVASGTMYLYRKQSATYNQIGTASITPADNDVIKCTVNSANEFRCYQNGVLKIGPVTDTFQSTATKHGIHSSSDNNLFDDFSITDNSGGGAPPDQFAKVLIKPSPLA